MTEKLSDNRDPAYENGTRRRTVHSPFRFGSWFRLHIIDILTLAAMGAIAMGVHYAAPAPHRSFPVYNLDRSIAWPRYAYPERDEIISLYAAVLLAWGVPFLFITLFQIRRRSADDWLTTNLGLLRSLVTAAVIQVLIKWLIGGLRPNFYAICQPGATAQGVNSFGSGFMFTRSICTGNPDKIDYALESMPSGHATAAWAGLFFLALYFNAQLKVISAHNPAYWKMVFFFAPLLGAFLISASKTIDAHNNWYDLLVGGIIGTLCALVAFRQTFASIWDFRFNHVLLPRATSLFHRKPFLPIAGRGPYYSYNTQEFQTHDLPFTREGGWGHGGGEQSTGAPGDASGLFGSGSGFGGLNNGVGTTGYNAGAPALGHNGPTAVARDTAPQGNVSTHVV